MLGLALSLALQAAAPDPRLERIDALLHAGDLRAARRVAERLDRERPDDPRILTLLGRVYLAWPVFGRWQAETLLTRAGTLAPDDPEPFYYLGLVGIALRGDDGEAVARRGLTRVLALEPAYRDAWRLWSGLYRGAAERRAGVAALSRHAGEPAPDLWRAQLLLELDALEAARSLLDSLVARAPADPAPRALLAQLLYEEGRDVEADAAYEAALAHAAADTGGVLWRQVRSTASPGERARWGRTPPEGRAAFFHRFWAYRRPSLRAPGNARIGEHFQRLRQARAAYPLLHPNSRWFHSPQRRRTPLFTADVPACLRAAVAGSAPLTALPPEPQAAPDDLSETLNLEDGLDDRGRVFVRYGEPDERVACEVGSETWRYHLPEGVLQVTFARRTGADSGGDAVVTPIAQGEWAAASRLLAGDRAGGPETLDLVFWTAAFRGGSRWQTALLLRPDSVAAVAALLDGAGTEVARDSSHGAPLQLTAPSGRYFLALDAERGDRTRRYRSGVTLPAFAGDSLAVSDLLLTDRDAPADRAAMAAAAPSDLRLSRSRPVRVYAEVYGLATIGGASRYEAQYRFERVDARVRPTTIGFRREQPARSVTIESLVVDPGRLAPGRYRVWLEIRDGLAAGRAASAKLEFELR